MPAPVSVSLGEIWVRRDGAADQVSGAVVIVKPLQRRGEIAHRLRKIGPESERAAKCFGSLSEFLEFVQDDAEVVGRLEIIGRDADDAAIFVGGFCEAPEPLQSVCEIEVICRASRMQFDRSTVAVDCARGVAFLQSCVAEIVVTVGEVRLDAKQFAKTGFGFGEIAALGERVREAMQRFDVSGLQSKSLTIAGDRACKIARES